MRRIATPARLQLLGVVFLCAVIAVVVYTHQLILPIFLGLFTWGKAWIKSLTPKLGLLFLKNGAVIQAKQVLVKASTHILVKSHRPWRRRIIELKVGILAHVKGLLASYLQLPLWLRTAIAIGVLLITAGSSFAVFALLIIPQPVLNWLRQRLTATLNKLGVTKLFATLWKFAVPAALRHRWHMHVKWTLGRRQVVAAQKLHKNIVKNASIASTSTSPTDNTPGPEPKKEHKPGRDTSRHEQ